MKQKKNFLNQISVFLFFIFTLGFTSCGGGESSGYSDLDNGGGSDNGSLVSCTIGVDCSSSTPPSEEWKVKSLSLSSSETCAIFENGKMRCWGHIDTYDYKGEELIGPDGDKYIQTSHARLNSCAVFESGSLRCWNDILGMIGDDESLDFIHIPIYNPMEIDIVNAGEKVVQVASGDVHDCVILNTGSVRCWGRNGEDGVLGYGNSNDLIVGLDNNFKVDLPILKAGEKAVQLALGHWHSCALLNTGAVRCWGNGDLLGYGDEVTPIWGDDPFDDLTIDVPVTAPEENLKVTQITAAKGHTCALLSNGQVRCWGRVDDGALGFMNWDLIESIDQEADNVSVPNIGGGSGVTLPSIIEAGNVAVTLPEEKVIQIATSHSHSCALINTGVVRCWGDNQDGILGYNNFENVSYPGSSDFDKNIDYFEVLEAGDVPILKPEEKVVQIALGRYHSCALLNTGAVRCWGYNGSGQLGYPDVQSVGDGEGPSILEAGDVLLY